MVENENSNENQGEIDTEIGNFIKQFDGYPSFKQIIDALSVLRERIMAGPPREEDQEIIDAFDVMDMAFAGGNEETVDTGKPPSVKEYLASITATYVALELVKRTQMESNWMAVASENIISGLETELGKANKTISSIIHTFHPGRTMAGQITEIGNLLFKTLPGGKLNPDYKGKQDSPVPGANPCTCNKCPDCPVDDKNRCLTYVKWRDRQEASKP